MDQDTKDRYQTILFVTKAVMDRSLELQRQAAAASMMLCNRLDEPARLSFAATFYVPRTAEPRSLTFAFGPTGMT